MQFVTNAVPYDEHSYKTSDIFIPYNHNLNNKCI